MATLVSGRVIATHLPKKRTYTSEHQQLEPKNDGLEKEFPFIGILAVEQLLS